MTLTSRSRRLPSRPHLLPKRMSATKPGTGSEPWDVKLAAYEARLDSFATELHRQGRQQEEGFERLDRHLATLFTKIDTANTRPVPWAIIVSAIVGVAGLGLTTTTGLALWANAYFGSSIRAAEARATQAHERLDATVIRIDERMERITDMAWQTRLESLRQGYSSPSRSAPALAE